MSMYVFLALNGQEIDAAEEDVVRIILAVAAGSASEKDLALWLKDHSRPYAPDSA